MTPDVVVSGGQIGVGNLPDIVGLVLNRGNRHGVLTLDAGVDGRTCRLIKGAAIEVDVGDFVHQVIGRIIQQADFLFCTRSALVLAVVVHRADHGDHGEVSVVHHRAHKPGKQAPIPIQNTGVRLIVGGNLAHRIVLDLDRNLQDHLTAASRLGPILGVEANPVIRVVKAGDGDLAAVHLNAGCVVGLIRAPLAIAASIGAGKGNGVRLEEILIVFGQLEVIGNHVHHGGGVRQGSVRAADGAADAGEHIVQTISIAGCKVIVATALFAAISQGLCVLEIAGSILHVAVGGYKLFHRVLAVTIIKVCIDVTVGVCTGKNTNGVNSRAVRSLAGLCTCDGIVTKCVVDVIRSTLCGITVREHNHNSAPLPIARNGICGENRIGHVQARRRVSVTASLQATYRIFDLRQAARRVHINQTIRQVVCFTCKLNDSNTIINIIFTAILAV